MKKLLFFILFAVSCNAGAASISAVPEVRIEAVTVGRECTVRPVKLLLFVKNKSAETLAVKIFSVCPDDALLRVGYEPLPLISKVILPVDSLVLGPGEKQQIKAFLFLPRNRRFLSKNYQFHIGFSAGASYPGGQNGVGVAPAVESVVLVKTHKDMAKTEIECDIDAAGGTSEDPDVVCLFFPEGALGRKIKLKIKELTGDEIPGISGMDAKNGPVIVFEFGPAGTIFKKPVRASFFYPDYDDDGVVDDTDIKAEELKVLFWNGFSWDLVGGIIDAEKKTVSADIYHFSVYGVFRAAAQAQAVYQPQQKIITPAAADGHNDFITFPGLQGEYEVDIFDISGVRVVTLENRNIWYGIDSEGCMVESGPYIYKYQVDVNGERKTITGVVVVAK